MSGLECTLYARSLGIEVRPVRHSPVTGRELEPESVTLKARQDMEVNMEHLMAWRLTIREEQVDAFDP